MLVRRLCVEARMSEAHIVARPSQALKMHRKSMVTSNRQALCSIVEDLPKKRTGRLAALEPIPRPPLVWSQERKQVPVNFSTHSIVITPARTPESFGTLSFPSGLKPQTRRFIRSKIVFRAGSRNGGKTCCRQACLAGATPQAGDQYMVVGRGGEAISPARGGQKRCHPARIGVVGKRRQGTDNGFRA